MPTGLGLLKLSGDQFASGKQTGPSRSALILERLEEGGGEGQFDNALWFFEKFVF